MAVIRLEQGHRSDAVKVRQVKSVRCRKMGSRQKGTEEPVPDQRGQLLSSDARQEYQLSGISQPGKRKPHQVF